MKRSSLTEDQGLRLAQFRVKKGVRWLNQHAPEGWQWNMFSMVDGGKVYFRTKDAYDNECVLALAFTNTAACANNFGYVTYGSVAHCKCLGQDFLSRHGFHATAGVPGHLLDIAWQEALVTYAKPSAMVRRHQTEVDRIFAGEPRRAKPWWLRLTAKAA